MTSNPVSLFLLFNDFQPFLCSLAHLPGGLCAAHGLSLAMASRSYSLLPCVDFSLWWLLLWGNGL